MVAIRIAHAASYARLADERLHEFRRLDAVGEEKRVVARRRVDDRLECDAIKVCPSLPEDKALIVAKVRAARARVLRVDVLAARMEDDVML